MYSVDSADTVVELTDVPQSSIGAPCPMILAGEHHLHLAYYLEDRSPDWDGTTVRIVGETTIGEPVGLVQFTRAYAHMFGPPNDEAFQGHPLASRGLGPYRVYEVRASSWVRRLERMNAVHPCHRPERFTSLRHFVFAFHDTTFECVAEAFIFSTHTGSVAEVLERVFAESRK
jgi:hypothetical protein